tara:strand:- start:1314 stop:2027 length:714 start_codon:yes stop_codon:yes gene_type:complete
MKILVIGDSCVDNFVYCDISRLCPEAPVPVLQPINTVTNAGMAGNVVRNLIALGAEVELITNEINIRKTRYVDNKSGQMIMRLDENDVCDAYNGNSYDPGYDAIVISDYDKGFLTEYDIQTWLVNAKCPTFVDTKKHLTEFAHEADFIKINKPEWDKSSHYDGDNIIVTDGKNGATYKNKNYPVEAEVKVSNVSGAGDTFLAGLVYAYVKSDNITEAISFANQCASKVVQERGVTVI